MPYSTRGTLLLCCTLLYTGLGTASPAQTQPIFAFERSLPVVQITIYLVPKDYRSVGDYDNDGWPDLAVVWDVKDLQILHNEGNSRFTLSDAIVQPAPGAVISGGTFGDCDNDGDLDLFSLTGHRITLASQINALYRNDRAVLLDIAPAAGLADDLLTVSAAWLDYDQDGHLDLVQVLLNLSADQAETQLRLYRNRGDCSFTDATEAAGLALSLKTALTQNERFRIRSKIVAADFTGDHWPDLYLTVPGAASNFMFHNSGQGTFRDATTAEEGDVGITHDLAIGDINNDGTLELYLHNVGLLQGGRDLPAHSNMLLNRNQGELLDITASAGLADLTDKAGASPETAVELVDLDNDGDLDLLRVSNQHILMLNQGDGIFVDATARIGDYIISTGGGNQSSLSLVDYNRDGFADAFFGHGPSVGQTNRNTGNANHWLQVVLTGQQSNRYGVGARVVVASGDRRQTRWIGGLPDHKQRELMAAFGLGDRAIVDFLEVHWPSGQIDRLQDIAADQRVRIIEGSGQYHSVRPTVWAQPPPDRVVAGDRLADIAVRPALFAAGARITSVFADLSAFGGPQQVALMPAADGVFALERAIDIAGPPGSRVLTVDIEQQTAVGTQWTQLSREVSVVPTRDLVIFTDDLSPAWQLDAVLGTVEPVYSGDDPVFAGQKAAALTVRSPADLPNWQIEFHTPEPIPLFGYSALHLAFHPGDLKGSAESHYLNLGIKAIGFRLFRFGDLARTDSLLGRTAQTTRIDINRREWQTLELPLDTVDPTGTLRAFYLESNMEGTFYIDDLRLVSAAGPPPASTAVEEQRSDAKPQAFALDPNYPNPFNSGTVIRFALPQSQHVELALYNLTGQQVAILAEGQRQAGAYAIHWDGRDDGGRPLASGVYLYRLRAGDGQAVTRKLLLLR